MNKIYCDTGSHQVALHHVALRHLLCHSAWSQYYGYNAKQYVTPPNPNTTPPTYRLDLGNFQEKTEKSELAAFDEDTESERKHMCGYVNI